MINNGRFGVRFIFEGNYYETVGQIGLIISRCMPDLRVEALDLKT